MQASPFRGAIYLSKQEFQFSIVRVKLFWEEKNQWLHLAYIPSYSQPFKQWREIQQSILFCLLSINFFLTSLLQYRLQKINQFDHQAPDMLRKTHFAKLVVTQVLPMKWNLAGRPGSGPPMSRETSAPVFNRSRKGFPLI